MNDVVPVAAAVVRRNLKHAYTNPALLIPSLIFPLVFLMAFAGGLSSLSKIPGFDFRSGYTAFQFVFVLIQSAAFGGVFTGFAIAADFESGIAQRLLLASPHRMGLVLGYVVSGMTRYATTAAFITVAGLLAGMRIDGGGVDLVGLYSLGLLVNVIATLFSVGLCMRARSMQAVPFLQLPIFIILFLAPVYVPKALLQGWVATASDYNPATALLQAGRGFISGAPQDSAVAFACALAGVALIGLYAVRGLRRAEREA